MQLTKKFAALVGMTALTAGFVVTISVGTAHAAGPCDYVAFRNAASSYSTVNGGRYIKTRPAAECSNVAWIADGTTFYEWCDIFNYYGNIWTYGRMKGTDTKGWVVGNALTYQDGTTAWC